MRRIRLSRLATVSTDGFVATGDMMARRKRKYVRPIEGNLNDPQSMGSLTKAWLEWMQIQNYSENSIKTRQLYLNRFILWAAERNLDRPHQITKPILERYQRNLYHHISFKGKRLTFRSQAGHIGTLRSWFKWLTRQNYLTSNPASEIQAPRIPKSLPARILSYEEVEAVFNAVDLETPLGLRDRTIMEVCYGTGIRRMELANLDIDDIMLKRRTLIVRRGKGQKDRMIPFNKRSAVWLEKYLYEIREGLVSDPTELALFLTNTGLRFCVHNLSTLVRHYLRKSGVSENGGPHMLRHSMATSMLENGADIRIIQAILGHARLDTTQLYTHVNIKLLQDIMDATHPARHEKQNDSDVKDPGRDDSSKDESSLIDNDSSADTSS